MTLTLPEILTKLYQLPEKFERDYSAGKWRLAAMDYENALLMSRFIHMDDEPRDRLLNRFNPKKVQDAFKAAGWYEEREDVKRIGDRKEAV